MRSQPTDGGSQPTMRLTRRAGEAASIESCTLEVVDGPDRGLAITIEGRPVRVGKGADNDLRLSDESVSRLHAIVSSTPDSFVVEDAGSTNGTRVDGVAVRSAPLTPGSRIQLGKTTLLFRSAARRISDQPTTEPAPEGFLGQSASMRSVFALVRQVAPTEATVVLTGETGTGKEVAARAIHSLSPRRRGPFVVFDCASANRDLLGSELFGHVKGAFTGADASHRGAFERAHTGTLFLDEIGELPLEMQTRLLGVLQRREVLPLGAETPRPVDVRIVTATHRDLETMIEKGTFREDLFFRLAVITISLPPLRDRVEDIPLLAAHFLGEMSGSDGGSPAITDAAMQALQQERWRGNVRELRNAVQRALVLSGGAPIEPRHLAAAPARGAAPVAQQAGPAAPAPPALTLEEVEKRTILGAYERAGRNKSRAARELGVSLSTLKRRLKDYGIEDEGEPGEGD